MTLRRTDFHFELPPELIAQSPPARRSGGRMLALDPLRDLHVTDLPGELREGDLVVLNDTRVLAARLLGTKDSGGKVEVLIERPLGEFEALAQVRASKSPKPGSTLRVGQGALEVLGREGEFWRLRSIDEPLLALLERDGHMPLPPYIDRPDAATDRERYQTVFAREPGAVAAPTAGLHFDDALLAAVHERGVEIGHVTLHVGAGTFQPVRVDNLSQHRMHRERFGIPAALRAQMAAARARGGRVVAIGTTVVRALESDAAGMQGETDIFITPGYEFRVVDALLTNFHLPESTLLMLVSAFAGREAVLAAYAHAVRARYRFFSYGDAMFIPRRIAA